MCKDILRIVSLCLLAGGVAAARAQVQPTTPSPGAAPPVGQGAAVTPAATSAAPAGPLFGEPPPAQPSQATPAATPKPKAPAKPTYRGKLTALDKVAMTFTVDIKGKPRTFQISSQTRFYKGGKPATMDDGAVGDEVTVVAKPAKKDKLQDAESVRFSGKTPATKPAPTSKNSPAKKAAEK